MCPLFWFSNCLILSQLDGNYQITRFRAVSVPIPRRAAMLRPLPLLLLLLLAVLFLSSTIRLGGAHEHDEEEDESSCEQSSDVRVDAEFRPGIVTVDGRAEDWADVAGPQLALLPALDFDEDKAYGGGPMTVKVRLSFFSL